MIIITQQPPDLDGAVAVGAVVDDGQRLLEARSSDPDNVSDQLADGDHHLGGDTRDVHTVPFIQ